MYRDGDRLIFSPSDLITFMEGDFAPWMDRWHIERCNGNSEVVNNLGLPHGVNLEGVSCVPDKQGEEMELVANMGQEHESRYLQSLKDEQQDLEDISQVESDLQFEATVDAMRKGAKFIFQARLRHGCFAGYADFLVRKSGQSQLGDYHYEVWDTKLARSVKPYFIVQLCSYSEMLEPIQGILPEGFAVVLGNNQVEHRLLRDYLYYFRTYKRSFLRFHENFAAGGIPHPGLSRSHGRWTTFANEYLLASDHLSQVANVTRTQIKKLEAANICTLTQLANSGDNFVPRLAEPVLHRLRQQARLQLGSQPEDKPLFEIREPDLDNPRRGLALLPPPSDQDVFFDIEGFPLVQDGLEYLLGAVCIENGRSSFLDWWAHDQSQEKQAFEDFIDWLHSRWKSDSSMHVYHYAAYEVTAMRRLMGQHATREREIDDLLRNHVFVDLYTVVRQGLVVGTPSYSLKDIEHLYMLAREGEVQTAGGSIVAYHDWIESGESQDWKESPLLKEIRDYNQVDCESTWELAKWLRAVQQDHEIEYLPPTPPKASAANDDVHPATILSVELLRQVNEGLVPSPEQAEIQKLLAYLLEYHWREAKPVFWKMFDRHEMTEQELINDFDCLGGLERTSKEPIPVKRSRAYEFSFDPDQDTKLHVGSSCFYAHDLDVSTTIETLDADRGIVEIKLGPEKSEPPNRIGLIPSEYVSATVIADAVFRYVEAWSQGNIQSQAVDDLLHRRPPRLKGHSEGPVVTANTDMLNASVNAVCRMQDTVLCIQGPPGTGKTHTAAHAILGLLKEGKTVGVTSNSHRAILNVLRKCREVMTEIEEEFRIVKVGSSENDPLIESGEIEYISSPKDISEDLGSDPIVIGGTAWFFSRPELQGEFDCLIIDEAGQFSLANTVGVGLAARNLVLVGDQMQLAQTVQGTHPGDSGQSALTYFLGDHATVPPEIGIFLNQTWRLHPDICRFISAAVYEGRLLSHPRTNSQRIEPNGNLVDRQAGIASIPVEHDSNTQSSEQEVAVIEKLVDDLLGCPVWDAEATEPRPLTMDDILLVAPFNMQVRLLASRLGGQARIGSVDKFQGQEAPVVIISMCSSTLEDSPRGADFLFESNRLNVAVSRAQSLAIIVGCPNLTASRCQSVREMELSNLFCRLIDYSNGIG